MTTRMKRKKRLEQRRQRRRVMVKSWQVRNVVDLDNGNEHKQMRNRLRVRMGKLSVLVVLLRS
jgi:hypothetical protein